MAKKRKKGRRLGLADIIGRPVVQAKKTIDPFLLQLLARSRKAPITVRAPCSCNGENENCFKCYGTGFYDKELTEEGEKSLVTSTKIAKQRKQRTTALATFASDSRGGDYAVREAGKFSSLPLHDDYSDESSS